MHTIRLKTDTYKLLNEAAAILTLKNKDTDKKPTYDDTIKTILTDFIIQNGGGG